MLPMIDIAASGKPGAWNLFGADTVINPPATALSGRAFKLLLQVQGQAHVLQSGRRTLLLAGELAFVDSAHPFRVAMEGPYRQVLVALPRALVTSMHRGIAHRTAVAHATTGSAMPLRQCLLAYADAAMAMSESAHHCTASALAQLLGVLDESAQRGGARGLYRMALALIDSHLVEAEPETVAAQLGISRRYLDLLFSRTGRTFSEQVWERRLVLAANRLRAPTALTITEVAHAVGFKDSSHFARAFRRRFGTSPRDWRGQRPHGD